MTLTMTLVFWNPRGISNKEVIFKEFLSDNGAVYAGISESKTYKAGSMLSDGNWQWDTGPEGKPTDRGTHPSRGVGAFINQRRLKASVVAKGKYTLWHRLEIKGGVPLVVGVGYFPGAQDYKGHVEANDELRSRLEVFRREGYHVVFGGDLNAHIGSNGDDTPTDRAGRLLLETTEVMGMVMVNTMDGRCKGGPTRVEGEQQSTIDYVMVSSSLAPKVKSLVIEDGQMGSDHRPLVLDLVDLASVPPPAKSVREVWKLENIPMPPESDWSWVNACQARFQTWATHTGDMLRAAEASSLDSQCVADVLDWSFQLALDELASTHLGTRKVKPRATPTLDASTRMAIDHRDSCEGIMRWVFNSKSANETTRTEVRKQYMAANRRVLRAASRRRELQELELFRDVESKQRDSKLFWSRFKRLRNSINVDKSPPPVAINSNGETVTDPAEVLDAWHTFSKNIASTDLKGTKEEGIYDDEYREEVEQRLELLRLVQLHQPHMDRPVDREEVFAAIRRLKMGKAPGQDGILTDIIKSGSDAVYTRKMRHFGMIDALTLIYNYILEHGVWPERWGVGVIVPLHKHDSRLDPANYRPITLMSVVGKIFGIIINNRLQKFSERANTIGDEQGGFRSQRGTPDQVFILRELLASRKERGLPTLCTFVDVRKAYDTVWRESAYVNIHDSGVKGKVWRQLQAMHKGLTRKVRLPFGDTEDFEVHRGVAQGAVESPWVYSNFVEGLATALRDAGYGVALAGRRVALLMYADDIVLLASSPDEMQAMNAVATRFAYQHRFQFNGAKCGVMVFNANTLTREAVRAGKWEVFGETIEVVNSYTYLGTILDGNGLSWNSHVSGAILKAKRRSNDLLWVCRSDRGMRPRTAITLWNALVRPLLEYCCELWSGQIPQYLVDQAERVQMTFLRGTLGLHENGSGVSDVVVRAEVGCEQLVSRWAKLKAGYWRRIFIAPPERLLRRVADHRHKEFTLPSNNRWGNLGWMKTAHNTLVEYGLGPEFDCPELVRGRSVGEWRTKVYNSVELRTDASRATEICSLPSADTYTTIKHWGVNTTDYSFSSGEEGRLGFMVPERYLDDRDHLEGTRLKLLCRLNCLPVLKRVGREVTPKWPLGARTCLMCSDSKVEDVFHFMMECPAYSQHRSRIFKQVSRIRCWRGDIDQTAVFRTLLGGRFGVPKAEDSIDRAVKRYLVKCWNTRARVTQAINVVLGTDYGVFKSPSTCSGTSAA